MADLDLDAIEAAWSGRAARAAFSLKGAFAIADAVRTIADLVAEVRRLHDVIEEVARLNEIGGQRMLAQVNRGDRLVVALVDLLAASDTSARDGFDAERMALAMDAARAALEGGAR